MTGGWEAAAGWKRHKPGVKRLAEKSHKDKLSLRSVCVILGLNGSVSCYCRCLGYGFLTELSTRGG